MNAEIVGLTDKQKEMRRTGTGGSEIAAVVGLNPYMTALDIYLGKADGFEQPDNEAMKRGRHLEPAIASWYAEEESVRCLPGETIRHAHNPHALCTPDRLVPVDGGYRDLSIKAPGPTFGRDTWGEDGTDDVPLMYLLQLQWELGILDSKGCQLVEDHHLAALVDGELRIYVIKRDAELFAQLLAENDEFWRKHVLPRVPPEVDGSGSASRWLASRFPKDTVPRRRATLHEEAMAQALREAEARREAAEAEEDTLINRLKEGIGAAGGLDGAFGRITWATNKKGARPFRAYWSKT